MDYLIKDDDSPEVYLGENNNKDLDGSDIKEEVTSLKKLTFDAAKDYLVKKAENAKPVALASSLCVISPIGLFLLIGKSQASNAISENAASGFGLIILLIVIAIAVAILIFNNRKLAGFEYLTEEAFVIDSEVRSYLEK